MSSASKGRASICDFHEEKKVQYIIQKMPANVSPCIPVRVKMRLQAAMLWAILSIPSILVTIILFISTNKSEFNKVSTMHMCCIKKKLWQRVGLLFGYRISF